MINLDSTKWENLEFLIPKALHTLLGKVWVEIRKKCHLTVITQGSSEGGHAAVAAEALPLLQAHALVGARVFLAGGAGAWRRRKMAILWAGFYQNQHVSSYLQQASANRGVRCTDLQKHTAVCSVTLAVFCKKLLGLMLIRFYSKTEQRKKQQHKCMYFLTFEVILMDEHDRLTGSILRLSSINPSRELT